MNAMSLLALCLIGSALCVLLSGYKPEYSLAVAVLIGVFIFGEIIKTTIPALAKMGELLSLTSLNSGYFKIALKSLGVCYISSFAADICRDFGQSSLAAKALLIGKCAVFLLSLPMLSAITEVALSFIGEV